MAGLCIVGLLAVLLTRALARALSHADAPSAEPHLWLSRAHAAGRGAGRRSPMLAFDAVSQRLRRSAGARADQTSRSSAAASSRWSGLRVAARPPCSILRPGSCSLTRRVHYDGERAAEAQHQRRLSHAGRCAAALARRAHQRGAAARDQGHRQGGPLRARARNHRQGRPRRASSIIARRS